MVMVIASPAVDTLLLLAAVRRDLEIKAIDPDYSDLSDYSSQKGVYVASNICAYHHEMALCRKNTIPTYGHYVGLHICKG